MPTGDITATNLGVVDIIGTALKTLLDAQNTGAATAGADISSLVITSVGNGQVLVTKMARAA